MACQTKFVSNIPNNKLEPVYLGGTPQTNGTTKSNGVFVPSCIKAEKEINIPKAQVVPQINEESFPSLLGPAKVPKPFLGYANAVKKAAEPLVKPVSKDNTKIPQKMVKKPKYDHYSDSENESVDSDTFLDDNYEN